MPRRGENIRKRKDGRWEGRYIKGYDSVKGKAKYASIYGKTYSEVKKKLNEAKFQTSTGRVYVDAKNKRFGEIVNNWFSIVKINLKPSSINKYQNLIENHILPELGHCKLKDLNSDALHAFLEKQGNTGNKKNRGSLSISTLQTLLYILNSSIKYAASNNMIALFSVHLLGAGKSKTPVSCLSEKDESVLDIYLSTHLSCRNAGIMLSLYCGLRIGEVCGLQWSDIDFEHKLISIKRTIQRIRVTSGLCKTKLWVGTPKSKSSIRTIPIPDFLMPALHLLSARSCSDAYGLVEPASATKVFVGETVPKLSECLGYTKFDSLEALSNVPIYLGDPIRIGQPVTLNVSRMKRSTLLVVGSEHRMSDQIMAVYMSNVLAVKPMTFAIFAQQ